MTHAESVYLDANATTIAHPEVIESMVSCMNEHGNPSSLHRAGQSARRRVELARGEVAALVGVRPSEIVFTSGGTESDNLAIAGTLDALPDRRRVLVAEVEHAAVRECVQRLDRLGRCELVNLPVDDCGIVRPKVVEEAIAVDPENTALASVMWANNETGVVQPIAEIGAVCRAHGVRFHTDAIQAIGRIPVDLSEVPVDLLTLSGHKFHGPKGIGALVVRPGLRLSPQNIGGPQERERRGGTENVPGVVGLGVAARLAQAWLESDAPAESGSRPSNGPCGRPSLNWSCTVSVPIVCGTPVVWVSQVDRPKDCCCNFPRLGWRAVREVRAHLDRWSPCIRFSR